MEKENNLWYNIYKYMKNTEFLEIVKESFFKYLETGSRSNEKLKILHSAIAKDLQNKLGKNYEIMSLGIGDNKEGIISGRYMEKKVDIVINKKEKENTEVVAGVSVKFVMSNYSQNSNNYFENMLGETANIRTKNKKYFQVFIILDEFPYYNKDGKIEKWEEITENNLSKYIKLSEDNEDVYFHTPNKTLFVIASFPKTKENYKTEIVNDESYNTHFQKNKNLKLSFSDKKINFQKGIIYNDYEKFIDKIIHSIKSV